MLAAIGYLPPDEKVQLHALAGQGPAGMRLSPPGAPLYVKNLVRLFRARLSPSTEEALLSVGEVASTAVPTPFESWRAILGGQMSVKNRPIDPHPLNISLVQKSGLLELLVLKDPIALGGGEISFEPAETSLKLADFQIGAELSAASEDALIHGGVLSSTWSKFEAFGFLSTEIARIIDTSIKSIQRKKKSDYLLSVSEADRTVRIGKVLVEALDAFEGDGEKVLGWLRSPVRHLGGKTPMEMLATEAGTALVRESLGVIAYGGVG